MRRTLAQGLGTDPFGFTSLETAGLPAAATVSR
ncbi:MAG: hypothetical protein ACI9MR_000936 [Myxococcota bacterium]|jgi:hypothetical protein